jgi:uncharacterized protein YndB with AHSA1/START domain
MADKPSLTLKRRIKAPPAQVFAAWTDPKKLAAWFGPGPSDEVLVAETDPRVGGSFRIKFRSGGTENECRGIYRQVISAQKLAFTWSWVSTPERESLVTITIAPEGEGSLLTLLHEQFADDAARDLHRQGWTGCLDKLEQFVAAS